jgi:hypothetical protein
MPTYMTTHQYCNANIYDHSPVKQLQHIGRFTGIAIYAGTASLASVPRCWYCYTSEWSLYVGIVTLMSGPICWYCYTEVLYIGIATLVSDPYMVVPM